MKNIANILIVIRDFVKQYKTVIFMLLMFFVIISIVKKCEKEPKKKIKTITKIVTKIDTVKTVEIKEVPKIVYVNKYIDKQGKKVIVYVDKPTDSTTIKANQYETLLTSNKAIANLKITTSGELLDVQGVIEYPEITTTHTITKRKNKSGLFVYGKAPINTNYINAELGLMYQFKNTILIMGGIEHNSLSNSANIKVGIGIKIF